jgi:phosphoglycerol transferase MdoB-like AlkP superfamily enzyme
MKQIKKISPLRPQPTVWSLSLAALMIVAAGVLTPEWFQQNYPSMSYMWDRLTLLKINAFRFGLLLIAVAGFFPHSLSRAGTRLRHHPWLRWLTKPWTQPGYLFGLLPFVVGSVLRQSSWWENSAFHWYHPSALLAILSGALDSALLLTCLYQALWRWRWLSWILAILLAVLSFVDWAFIHYTGTRFNWLQFSLNPGGAASYLTGLNLTTFAAFVVVSFVGARRALRPVGKAPVLGIWRAQLVALALLLILRPGYWVHVTVNAPWTALWRNGAKTHFAEAARYSEPPLVYLARVSLQSNADGLVEPFTNDEQDALSEYRRTVVNEQPPKLSGPVLRRIILVTIESFSLRFQSARNPGMPGELTPFLDLQPHFLSNFRSVSLPTQFGLASHFCSHPNGIALATSGHPNALPAYLARHGWDTVNFQPASLVFQSAARRFRELGFKHIYDRDHFAQNLALKDYISGWGLCDRKVYEQAATYLADNKDKRVFLHILTADTHGPEGRLDYHGLDYPQMPAWIKAQGQYAKTFESWFRADHDLSLFVTSLKRQGLWDEGTVLIVTGDHNATLGYGAETWTRTLAEPIERIPWVLMTPRHDLTLGQNDMLASQCDTAPTIAHLAGLPLLREWWGQSLLAPRVVRPLLAWREKIMRVETDGVISDVDPKVERLFWKLELPRENFDSPSRETVGSRESH